MADFVMPSLGADMDRGTLSSWLVAEGDPVTKGDIVAVIQTEKSDVEVEVFESGVVEALLVEPGTEVEVGAPLARIGTGATASAPPPPTIEPTPEPATEPARQASEIPPHAADAGVHPPVSGGPGRSHASVVLSPIVRHLIEDRSLDPSTIAGTGPGGRITRADVERAGAERVGTPAAANVAPAGTARSRSGSSPFARRRAAELGIDLADVTGSGPGGAVVERDLLAHGSSPAAEADLPTSPPASVPDEPDAHDAPKATKAPTTPDRRQAMRTAIARLMTTANREIPHYHVLSTLDVEAALAWLAHHNASVPPADRVLPAAVLLRATAVAATSVRDLNGWWQDDRFVASPTVDLGVAISLRGGGLVTPTISDAGSLGLLELMTALRELVARSRRGALRAADLAPASLTVTNLGDQGAEEVIGVIHPPQVAIIGFGRTTDRVLAVDGMVAVRPTVRATVSGDHRASDGHAGSLLLAAIAKALEHPDEL